MIRAIKRRLWTWLDDAFGNPMIYYYQRTLIKLTIVTLIAVYIVIRGSTAPLLIDNSIMRFLFCSSVEEDKTLYNVGISVIAAYIFYLVQVYIPEKARFKILLSYSLAHRHEIYLLNQYLLAWDKFYNRDKREYHFHEFSYQLNHQNNGSVTKEIYQETIEELPTVLEKIMQTPGFNECDLSYREFINRAYFMVWGHLHFMDDHFPRWSEEPITGDDYKVLQDIVMKDLKRIQNRLSSIEHYYLEVESIGPYEGKSDLQKEAGRLL